MSGAADVRGTGAWPKQLPPFTDEEQRVRDAFMARWLEYLPTRGEFVERFNHGYPLKAGDTEGRTLEIGAGLGAHLQHEDLERQEYYAVELLPELAESIRERYPGVTTIVGDCQARLPFGDAFFDRVLAIHVLEHLPDLPSALDEVARLLRPEGRFVAVIPCEGGLVYSLARRFTSKRLFEREFGRDYDWFIRSEHINLPWEIESELEKRFELVESRYYPLRVPSVGLNLVIGLTMRRRSGPSAPGEAAVGGDDAAQRVDVGAAEVVDP
jgi:SAM-dependent methyltransferase